MSNNDDPEEYDFSKARRGAVIPRKGKTRITIWIDDEVLDWFRDQAEKQGRGYQTAINEALRSYSRQPDQNALREIVREAVRLELQTLQTTHTD